MSDERYYVETPEVVAIAYQVAGMGSRCLAALADTLLILLLQVALGAAIFGAALGFNNGELSGPVGNLLLALWAILGFLLLWGYYLLFELIWSGQSPGKRLLGLRVIREGGRPVDFAAAALRNLIRVVDFVPFGYGLGVLAMFVDRHARRLGDLAAGTLVVREDRPLTLDALTQPTASAPLPPRSDEAPLAPLLPNLQLLGPAEDELAEAFLRQREQLTAARRADLAARIATFFRARLGLPEGGDPERFIEHLARERRLFVELAEHRAM